jgi:catechol 2,3-dioxygenase-like lactoylglutathione lyase family enzyme
VVYDGGFIVALADASGVQARDIDHLNLYVPADGVDRALSFYRDLLGFETENVEAYRAGERSLFTFRAGGDVIHVMPDEAFEPPGRNYNHVAVGVDADEATLRSELANAGVEVDRERERRNRPGADVALYVSDPFGYGVELRPEG